MIVIFFFRIRLCHTTTVYYISYCNIPSSSYNILTPPVEFHTKYLKKVYQFLYLALKKPYAFMTSRSKNPMRQSYKKSSRRFFSLLPPFFQVVDFRLFFFCGYKTKMGIYKYFSLEMFQYWNSIMTNWFWKMALSNSKKSRKISLHNFTLQK